MPGKRGPTTRTSARRRKDRQEEKYTWKIVPVLYKKLRDQNANLVEEWLLIQDALEIPCFASLEADGVDTDLWVYYLAFARRLLSKCLRFSSVTYTTEETSLKTEFVLRDLDSTVLDHLISIVHNICNWVKGIVVTLQDIEDKLDNGTWGLAALKALIDAIETKLDDGTWGLEALKDLIDDIEAKLDKGMHCMTFLSWIMPSLSLPAAAGDRSLPDVVISGLPAGATLDKVLVFLIVRAIENTNAGGTNAIQGNQDIRIKKNTGAWGVDDVPAIQLLDNMWLVAASTREFGDVIGGRDSYDVKSEVDGNGTYNLRFENADVDLDFLRLNDVQVLIKVWYH